MPATIEELIALVLALQERVVKAEARADTAEARATAAEARCAVLEAENARLRERVRELETRLGKDSSNSHKPPSSDSPYKAKPPGKKGKRKVGGQPGHKGVTRLWVPPEKVTSRKVVRLPACVCGASLAGIPATTGTWARQVVEIPAIVPDVTEYVFETVRCPCCSHLNAPDVPPEAATCTGPNLTALAATLVGEYHLSRDAAASLLESVLSMPICAATVQNCCAQVSAALETATDEVAASLPTSAGVHMDETSWKQRKVLHWLWIAVSETVTSFAIHLRRGRHQLDAWFPNGFKGVVTCDRWRPYETFARRQLCWSHLERDLQAIIDGGRTGTGPATQMMAGADAMFATWGRFIYEAARPRQAKSLKPGNTPPPTLGYRPLRGDRRVGRGHLFLPIDLTGSAVRGRGAQAREPGSPCTSERSSRGRVRATLPERTGPVDSLQEGGWEDLAVQGARRVARTFEVARSNRGGGGGRWFHPSIRARGHRSGVRRMFGSRRERPIQSNGLGDP